MSLTEMEANSLVRGLIFVVQKSRSDIKESMSDLDEDFLSTLNPLFFGKTNILPRLLEWQQRCDKAGVITGHDLFNFTKFLDMDYSGHVALGLLAIYGYTQVPLDGPPISWMSQQWRYLSA